MKIIQILGSSMEHSTGLGTLDVTLSSDNSAELAAAAGFVKTGHEFCLVPIARLAESGNEKAENTTENTDEDDIRFLLSVIKNTRCARCCISFNNSDDIIRFAKIDERFSNEDKREK